MSDLWLRRYLSPKQLEAIARLSVFATFDSTGAAAVMHGADADPAQLRDAELMLRCLRGLSVLQEVQQAASAYSEPPRYGMHLLVRGLAAEVQQRQPEDSQAEAVTGFVDHVISIGNRLADLEQTAANAATTADLLGLEMPNMQTMLQLLSAPSSSVIAVALLEDDSSSCRETQSRHRPAGLCAVKVGPAKARSGGRAHCIQGLAVVAG